MNLLRSFIRIVKTGAQFGYVIEQWWAAYFEWTAFNAFQALWGQKVQI
jgi:hypothetical protein